MQKSKQRYWDYVTEGAGHKLLVTKQDFSLERVVRLFNLLTESDQNQAQEVFEGFKDKWVWFIFSKSWGLSEAAIDARAQRCF